MSNSFRAALARDRFTMDPQIGSHIVFRHQTRQFRHEGQPGAPPALVADAVVVTLRVGSARTRNADPACMTPDQHIEIADYLRWYGQRHAAFLANLYGFIAEMTHISPAATDGAPFAQTADV